MLSFSHVMRHFAIPRALLLLVWLAIGLWPVYAQQQHPPYMAKASYAEKIYLQLDADVYTNDQTIWFKAVVLESSSHFPSMFSGVLHVELIAPNEQIVATKRIKLDQGSGHGAFELRKSDPTGKYLLRAYTEWNHNFGNDFVFSRYLDIFPVTQETKMAPIIDIKLDAYAEKSYRLQAKLFPRLLDPAHQKQLTVQLVVDGQKDSLTLKESKQGYYILDYPLKPHANTATIHLYTANGIRYVKSLAMPHAPIDLQFFPEGGEWTYHVPTKIGFKAIDQLGKGIAVSGKIRNNQGDTICSFQSNHLGMGSVKLIANKGDSYHAVLDSLADSDSRTISAGYPLPAPTDKGYSLSLAHVDQAIAVHIHQGSMLADSLFVQVSCRGTLYYLLKILPKTQRVSTSLPKHTLPEGIILCTLLDQDMRPIAERLIFNERPETRLTIQASSAKDHYGKRSKTALQIQVKPPQGNPKEAKLSVMAVGRDHIGQKLASRQNILTHFLLQSELRGLIEEPNHYFQGDSATRFADLDALMLTQGWRHYKYDEPVPQKFSFVPAFSPSISGDVSGVISKKKQAGVQLSLMGFGASNIIQVQNSDSLGRFYFQFPDQYTDTLNVVLQTANKTGKKRDYTINLNKRHVLEMNYDPLQSLTRIDSVTSRLASTRQERSRQQTAQDFNNEGIRIAEVVVEGKVRSAQEQKVLDTYGEADVVISGKAIQDKEAKWSYGLYSVLLFNFPKDIRIERSGGTPGYLVAGVHGPEKTLVVVDGIPVPGYAYDLIPNFPPSEVKSFEIIRFAKNFANLFVQTYPDTSPLSIPMVGHVIAIYTHAGQGMYAVRKPVGITQTAVPVYSPTITFYTPRYESPADEATNKADWRTLLHWLPNISTDALGNADVHFYNSDNPGEVTVVIEAFNADGEIGYTEWRYAVDERAVE